MSTNETLLLDQLSQLRTENAELARRLAFKDRKIKLAIINIDSNVPGFARQQLCHALRNT